MDRIIRLYNIEIREICYLNITKKSMEYIKDGQTKYNTGWFQRDDCSFIALYPTPEGPMIYYNDKEYPINKELHIYVKKDGKDRDFIIEEYGIHMKYKESKYLDFDIWSTEMDVDLCWRISQLYKKDDFYKDYTKDVYCREEDILQANKDLNLNQI